MLCKCISEIAVMRLGLSIGELIMSAWIYDPLLANVRGQGSQTVEIIFY